MVASAFASSPSSSATPSVGVGAGSNVSRPSSTKASSGSVTSMGPSVFMPTRTRAVAPDAMETDCDCFTPSLAVKRTSTSFGLSKSFTTRTVTVATPASSRRCTERKPRFSSRAPTERPCTSGGSVTSPTGPSVKKYTRCFGTVDSSLASENAGDGSCDGCAGFHDSSAERARATSSCGPASSLGFGPVSMMVSTDAPSDFTNSATASRAASAAVRPPFDASIERLPSTTTTTCVRRAVSPQRASARKSAAATRASVSSASETSRENRSKRGPASARWSGVRQRKSALTRRGGCLRRRKYAATTAGTASNANSPSGKPRLMRPPRAARAAAARARATNATRAPAPSSPRLAVRPTATPARGRRSAAGRPRGLPA